MDNFAKKFIEEATDNINDLENALLELDNDSGNKEIIEKIFRSLHSLKGGGAMFGFDGISEITHELENIYDDIRKEKRQINDEITSLTLEIVDHLRNLLTDQKIEDADIMLVHNMQIERINQLSNTTQEKITNTAAEKISGQKTFYIRFQPNPDILNNGTNPLYLIDELCELGESRVVSNLHNLLNSHDYKPDNNYIGWEVYLATHQNADTIHEVFMFVEDDSEIEVRELSPTNILNIPEIELVFTKIPNNSAALTVTEITKILDAKVADKNKKTANLHKKEQKITSVRVSSDKLDGMMNMVSELVTTQARLTLYSEKNNDAELVTIAENVQKLTRQLRDIAFSIVLIPIDTIIMRFQRLVRDLSKNLNKKIEFITKGTDTELDKSLIESLVDPIMHIIRNSIDHGIESTDERKKAGKPETGTIVLNAYYSGVNVNIDISDDGRGIDKDKVLQKAIDKKLVPPETKLSDEEILQLTFMPGFSTAAVVTDVSGRGVGMDVVKKKINQVRGEVKVSSVPGKGTTISIEIPITLSIIDGLLVRIDHHHFILPMVVVHKIYSIKKEETQLSHNDLLILDGEQVPFMHLRTDFDLLGTRPDFEEVVVATYNGSRVGLVFDSVVGEYQAVLKPLGKQFKNQEYISGASILGDGRIALVLDTNKMIKHINAVKKDTLHLNLH